MERPEEEVILFIQTEDIHLKVNWCLWELEMTTKLQKKTWKDVILYIHGSLSIISQSRTSKEWRGGALGIVVFGGFKNILDWTKCVWWPLPSVPLSIQRPCPVTFKASWLLLLSSSNCRRVEILRPDLHLASRTTELLRTSHSSTYLEKQPACMGTWFYKPTVMRLIRCLDGWMIFFSSTVRLHLN